MAITVMKRYEMKYIINAEQADNLREHMKGRMEVDQYGKTSIASLYYDTPDRRLIRESLEKAFSGKEVKLTKGVLSDPGLLGTVPGGSSVLLLEKLEKSTYAGIVSELNYLKGRDVSVKGLVLFE